MIKNRWLLLIVLLLKNPAFSQVSAGLSLEECYQLAKQNYPLIKQQELIKKSNEYSLKNVEKGFLPQIVINGQATYQSAVTSLPIQLPGVDIPQLSKDQYKIYAELNQPLYDGGLIKQQKKMQEATKITEDQKLETELYKIKDRINQLFFGILLTEEQILITELFLKDLNTSIKKTEALVQNGLAYKSNSDILQAESLKNKQKLIELQQHRKAYAEMLGMFVGKPGDQLPTLVKPQPPVLSGNITRPEIKSFEQQSRNLDLQSEMLKAKNRPKFNLFIQGGYGRPALNMLDNTFEPYYIGGIRLHWSLTGLYTIKNDRAIIQVNKSVSELQKELFVFNTSFALKQQNAEVQKYIALLSSDDEIIVLRNRIKSSATSQLENGVISASDFIREANAEEQAKETKSLHEIQMLLAMYNQKITTGE